MATSYMKGNFTLAAATATNLLAAMVAEGYTGRAIGKYLKVYPKALTDVFYGDANTTDAATGIPIITTDPLIREAGNNTIAIDPASYWLFSTGGGDISVHFEAF